MKKKVTEAEVKSAAGKVVKSWVDKGQIDAGDTKYYVGWVSEFIIGKEITREVVRIPPMLDFMHDRIADMILDTIGSLKLEGNHEKFVEDCYEMMCRGGRMCWDEEDMSDSDREMYIELPWYKLEEAMKRAEPYIGYQGDIMCENLAETIGISEALANRVVHEAFYRWEQKDQDEFGLFDSVTWPSIEGAEGGEEYHMHSAANEELPF